MKSLFTPQQDITIQQMYLDGHTTQKIAESFGSYKQSVINSLKCTNTPLRTNWKRASGQKSGKWNGGIRIIKGYIHILIPTHLARKDGYSPLHRMLAEYKYQRKLLPTEVVNHIDGNPLNNDLDNLEIFKTNGEHIKGHIKNFKRNKKGKFSDK